MGLPESEKLDKAKHKHRLPTNELIESLNEMLEPEKIRIHAIRHLTQSCNFRFSASSRVYHYYLPLSLLEGRKSPLEDIETVGKCFLGLNNFKHFMKASAEKAGVSPNRSVLGFKGDSLQEKGWIKIEIAGNSFVQGQIRKVIGAILKIIRNDSLGIESISEATLKLQEQLSKQSTPSSDFSNWLAPPDGLVLHSVTSCSASSFKMEQVQFNNYNNRENIPGKLEFSEEELGKMREFEDELVSQIFEKEENFLKWFEVVKAH